jgi:hypothetical protein
MCQYPITCSSDIMCVVFCMLILFTQLAVGDEPTSRCCLRVTMTAHQVRLILRSIASMYRSLVPVFVAPRISGYRRQCVGDSCEHGCLSCSLLL